MGLEIISGVERRRHWSVADTDGGGDVDITAGRQTVGDCAAGDLPLSSGCHPNEITNLAGL